MTDNKKEGLLRATRILLQLAASKKLMDQKTISAHLSLAEHDPQLIHKLVLKAFLKLGYRSLWTEHSDFMEQLNSSDPLLRKFVSRSAVRLGTDSIKTGKYTRIPEPTIEEVKKLIYDVRMYDEVISQEEFSLYNDLVDWEAENIPIVELDILKKFDDLNYIEFDKKAPHALQYIKQYFENWFHEILRPYKESAKGNAQS